MMSTGILHRRVMHFPGSIPGEEWVKDRLLWANSIGSLAPDGGVWTDVPEREPWVETLRQMDEFQPCTLPMTKYGDMVRDLDAALKVPIRERKEWQRQLDALPPLPADAWGEAPSAEGGEPSAPVTAPGSYRFVYRNKLPEPVAERLVRLGVLTRLKRGDLEVTSDEEAAALFSVAAKYARIEGEPASQLLPDAQTDRALALAAQPGKGRQADSALTLQLPLMFSLRPNLTVEEILAFRHKEGNDALRRDYLGTLQEALDLSLSGESTGLRAVVERDVRLAGRSFLQRCENQNLVTGGLGALGVMIPLATQSVPGLVAGGVLATLAVFTPAICSVSKRSPGFIRAARKQDLLQR